jgi:hypothetical protein
VNCDGIDIVTCLQHLKILNGNLTILTKDSNCSVEYGSHQLEQETLVMSKTSLPSRFDLESDVV